MDSINIAKKTIGNMGKGVTIELIVTVYIQPERWVSRVLKKLNVIELLIDYIQEK
jgi:hypothetical protein